MSISFSPSTSFDWGNAIPNCLTAGFRGEGTCRQYDALVGATGHRAPEVAYLGWGDCAGVPLALEENAKTDERIDFKDAIAVETAIARSACYSNMLKSRLPQQPLAQALESGGRQ
jgi:hypothetical protein